MKKGFTIAEVMIAMVLIGVIVAVVMPIVKNTFKDEYKLRYKKAFSMVADVVSDAVADVAVYPDAKLNNDLVGGNYRLCTQFVAKLNTVGATNCSNTTPSVLPTGPKDAGTPNFTTTNGMNWYGFSSAFSAAPGSQLTVQVDIDGVDKGLNTTGIASGANNKDVLTIIIRETGQATAPTITPATVPITYTPEESYLMDREVN